MHENRNIQQVGHIDDRGEPAGSQESRVGEDEKSFGEFTPDFHIVAVYFGGRGGYHIGNSFTGGFGFGDFQGLLVFHFDNFRGPDFLGEVRDVWSILGIGVLALFLNGFLADELYWRERFLAYLLSGISVIFSLLILWAILAIISFN